MMVRKKEKIGAVLGGCSKGQASHVATPTDCRTMTSNIHQRRSSTVAMLEAGQMNHNNDFVNQQQEKVSSSSSATNERQ